jgi:Arc/MetJ-type ribon-helix-helix transcriptional regulator
VTRKPRVVTFRMDQATWDRMRELVSYTRYREASSFIREGIDLMLRQEDEQPSECGRRQSCLTSADLYRPSSTSVWRSVRTSQNGLPALTSSATGRWSAAGSATSSITRPSWGAAAMTSTTTSTSSPCCRRVMPRAQARRSGRAGRGCRSLARAAEGGLRNMNISVR